MEEFAILRLEHSRIEKILFEYYSKDYGPNGKAKIEKTFKVDRQKEIKNVYLH